MTPKTHIPSRSVLLRNLLANWVGLSAEMAVAFFLTPFIIGSLGVAVYGVWSLANGVIGYLGLIDLGVRSSIGRFINQHLARHDDRALNEVISTAFIFLTGSGIIVLIVAIFLGAYFTELFPKTPIALGRQLGLVLPLMAAGLWLAFIGAIYRNVLAAFDRFDTLNAIGIAALVVRATLVVSVLKLGIGLVGLVGATVIAGSFTCLTTVVLAYRTHRPLSLRPVRVSMARLKEMWRFGVVAFITRCASQVVYQSDQIILMAFFGPHAVAVFGVASMLILYAQKLVEQLGAAINPSLMKSGTTGDLPGLRKTYLFYPRASYFIAIPLYVGFIVFGGAFINLWVGPEFADSALVLSILSAAELASLAGGAGGLLLFGLGRLRFNMLCSIAEAFVNVALTLVLVGLAHQGIVGTAIGTLIAAALFRGLAHPIYTTRALDLRYMRYVSLNGWRVLVAGAFAYVVFQTTRIVLHPETWDVFALAVAVSSIPFVIGGPLILFGAQESLRLMRAMPGMSRERNA